MKSAPATPGPDPAARPAGSAAVPPAAILLVDNGSLQPQAIIALRALADRLGAALGQAVDPVSFLHADRVPAARLGGRPAEILAAALERRARTGLNDLLVVPLFFGPTASLTSSLPRLASKLGTRFPRLRVRAARCLVDPGAPADGRLAEMIADHVRASMAGGNARPALILVDHGSPTPAVGAVREHLAGQLADRLGPAVRGVLAASMDRRPGPAYAFNDPLLARAFERPGFDEGDVIVALQFLLPGRHAGPGGDVARICAAARRRHPGLRTVLTELVGAHPGLIALLADRAREAMDSAPLRG
ncbi:MAG TPA: cobalamin biosynthesis protein CbiX [Opitutaceae bacterium]|nr:cobalamin biosynthesis protein CbiX [Opitutaceae bacterium]